MCHANRLGATCPNRHSQRYSWAQPLHCQPQHTHPVCAYCSVAGDLDMGQVRAELMGDHNVDQHAYKRIVGARRDAATGQVDVAVVWQNNTLHPTGGSWERYTIQRYYRTKVLLTKVLFGQRYYRTKVLSGTKSDQYLIFNWNMKLWPFSHPLMSQSKNLKPNLSPWPFSAADSAADSAAPDDTSGYDSRSRSNVTLAKPSARFPGQ